MRCILSIIITLIFPGISFSQKLVLSGKITYVSTIRNSLFMPGSGNTVDTTWLYFNDTASSYLIDTKLDVDSRKLSAELSGKGLSESSNKEVVDIIMNDLLQRRFQFDYHPAGSSTLSKRWAIGQKDYCRVDTLADPEWELFPDTTHILGFACQKAVSKLIYMGGRQRKFTAWYALDLPLPYGPKNVFGLPGLVLMADSEYYNFTAVKINIPVNREESFQLTPCKGLPFISSKSAEELSGKMQADFMNMQKLRANP